MAPKRQSKKAAARLAFRDRQWPDADLHRWPRDIDEGWCKVPRAISLILAIINDKNVAGGVDLTTTYLALLSHNMGDAVVEIDDDQEMATMCGLMKKTWAQRIRVLEKIGMIAVAEKLGRPIGYVLLRHPMDVIYKLRAEGKVDDKLWNALITRNTEVGATPCRTEVLASRDEREDDEANPFAGLGLKPAGEAA